MKYEDYKIAICNLVKMENDSTKDLLKTQLFKTAKKDLDSQDFSHFKLLYTLSFDFRKIFPSDEMTSSVSSLFS